MIDNTPHSTEEYLGNLGNLGEGKARDGEAGIGFGRL
jgi:hypothetical protein